MAVTIYDQDGDSFVVSDNTAYYLFDEGLIESINSSETLITGRNDTTLRAVKEEAEMYEDGVGKNSFMEPEPEPELTRLGPPIGSDALRGTTMRYRGRLRPTDSGSMEDVEAKYEHVIKSLVEQLESVQEQLVGEAESTEHAEIIKRIIEKKLRNKLPF